MRSNPFYSMSLSAAELATIIIYKMKCLVVKTYICAYIAPRTSVCFSSIGPVSYSFWSGFGISDDQSFALIIISFWKFQTISFPLIIIDNYVTVSSKLSRILSKAVHRFSFIDIDVSNYILRIKSYIKSLITLLAPVKCYLDYQVDQEKGSKVQYKIAFILH